MDRLRRQRLLAAWSGVLLTSLGITACNDSESAGSMGTVGTERCVDAQPELIGGQPTGFELCNTGRSRASREICPDLRETNNSANNGTINNATNGSTGGSTNNAGNDCGQDSDCSGQTYGHCGWVSSGTSGVLDRRECVNGCRDDKDCGDGFICECQDPIGVCVRATCVEDSDCGGDLRCARYIPDPGCLGFAYACQTDRDECDPSLANTCPEGETCTVAYNTGQWVCAPPGCTAGRPFIVEGAERLAPLEGRGDWLTSLAETDLSMSAEIRDALSAHWASIGLMEHASVAAFARFALHLMQLGAPPQLLFDTQAAMKDETEHAQLCFALASRYGGDDVGPGRLDLDGAFEESSLIDILDLVIEEGCIGETTAALEAAESAELASDPVVAAVLRRIADDEQRHAGLAWATLKWALETQGPEVREALKAAFERAFAHQAARPTSADNPNEAELLRHGVFSDRLRDGVRRDVIASVVAPTFAALWAGVEVVDAING